MSDCGCITHPAEASHDEHMDSIVKAQNQEVLAMAVRRAETASSFVDAWYAEALFRRFAALEIGRLNEKERWMQTVARIL